jgi:hypothetical protein
VGRRLTEAGAWEALTGATSSIVSTWRVDGWLVGLPEWAAVIDQGLSVRASATGKNVSRTRVTPTGPIRSSGHRVARPALLERA